MAKLVLPASPGTECLYPLQVADYASTGINILRTTLRVGGQYPFINVYTRMVIRTYMQKSLQLLHAVLAPFDNTSRLSNTQPDPRSN